MTDCDREAMPKPSAERSKVAGVLHRDPYLRAALFPTSTNDVFWSPQIPRSNGSSGGYKKRPERKAVLRKLLGAEDCASPGPIHMINAKVKDASDMESSRFNSIQCGISESRDLGSDPGNGKDSSWSGGGSRNIPLGLHWSASNHQVRDNEENLGSASENDGSEDDVGDDNIAEENGPDLLIIRQQPTLAHACGYGERDRLIIHPLPILQRKTMCSTLTPEVVSQELSNPYCIVSVTL